MGLRIDKQICKYGLTKTIEQRRLAELRQSTTDRDIYAAIQAAAEAGGDLYITIEEGDDI